jgi:hypothetical protein
MRSLIVVTVLCLASTQAFACVLDDECATGNICVDRNCIHVLTNDDDDAPVKRATKGKTCYDDGDCQPGSQCIKGSGLEGVCIGH